MNYLKFSTLLLVVTCFFTLGLQAQSTSTTCCSVKKTTCCTKTAKACVVKGVDNAPKICTKKVVESDTKVGDVLIQTASMNTPAKASICTPGCCGLCPAGCCEGKTTAKAETISVASFAGITNAMATGLKTICEQFCPPGCCK